MSYPNAGNPALDAFMVEIKCNRAKYAAACSCLDLARFHELVLAVAGKSRAEVEQRHRMLCCATGGGKPSPVPDPRRDLPLPVPIPTPIPTPVPPKGKTKEECVQLFIDKACSPTAREAYRTIAVIGPLIAAGRDGKVASFAKALGKLAAMCETMCESLASADPARKAAGIALAGTLMCVTTYLLRMQQTGTVKTVLDILFPLMPALRPILNEMGLVLGEACCNTTTIGPVLRQIGLPELEVIGE